MAGPKVCTSEEIASGVAPATATNHLYGAVDIILTDRVQHPDGTWTITFSLQGEGAQESYQAEWGNLAHMWAPCPSTLPSNATIGASGNPPETGSYGKLYLSEQFLEQHQILIEPKWPLRLITSAPSMELEIYPLKLELTGLEMRSGRLRKASINLMDTRLAARRQTIELDGSSPVKVRLTQAAFTRFRLPFVPSSQDIGKAITVLQSHARPASAFASAGAASSAPAAATAECAKVRAASVLQELADALGTLSSAMTSVASGDLLAPEARAQLGRLFASAA